MTFSESVCHPQLQLVILCLIPSQEREQNVSEKSSIGFEIDGFGSRGDRIFVMAVDEDSLAKERGVRVGDEVSWRGGEGVVTLCCSTVFVHTIF